MDNLSIQSTVPNGDSGLLIRFTESDNRLQHIHQLAQNLIQQPLAQQPLAQQLNVIPATDSLVIVFNTPINDFPALTEQVKHRIVQLPKIKHKPQTHEVPVCYDPSLARDLQAVCETLNLTVDELIQIHTEAIYTVNMLGFLPGFSYLSGSDTKLILPRKATPSFSVPAGSIAIADDLTGIYAMTSPGGWHVIGQTPVKMIDWQNQNPALMWNPLDEIKFKAISLKQFQVMNASSAH